MCEEESEDHEAVAKLFEINDSIHRTQERYKLMKKGDIEGASRIPKGTLGTSGAGVTKGPGNELSLLDFGPADGSASNGSSDKTASAASAAGTQLLAGALSCLCCERLLPCLFCLYKRYPHAFGPFSIPYCAARLADVHVKPSAKVSSALANSAVIFSIPLPWPGRKDTQDISFHKVTHSFQA